MKDEKVVMREIQEYRPCGGPPLLESDIAHPEPPRERKLKLGDVVMLESGGLGIVAPIVSEVWKPN